MAYIQDQSTMPWYQNQNQLIGNPQSVPPLGSNDFGIQNPQLGYDGSGIANQGNYGPSVDVSQGATHDFNPTLGLSREAWRDQYQGLGNVSPQAADAWLRSHGAQQQAGKGDTWQTPYGDMLDLQIGRGAANANGGNISTAWTPSSGGSSNGSVMGNGGAPQGFDMQQFINALSGGQPMATGMPVQQGAVPYNQYAGQQQGVSNYFQQPQNQMQTTGQTNGTLLGTTMSNQPVQQNNPMATPRQATYNSKAPTFSWMKTSNQNNPLGAPSTYNQQKDTQTSTNPLPNNNMMGGSF